MGQWPTSDHDDGFGDQNRKRWEEAFFLGLAHYESIKPGATTAHTKRTFHPTNAQPDLSYLTTLLEVCGHFAMLNSIACPARSLRCGLSCCTLCCIPCRTRHYPPPTPPRSNKFGCRAGGCIPLLHSIQICGGVALLAPRIPTHTPSLLLTPPLPPLPPLRPPPPPHFLPSAPTQPDPTCRVPLSAFACRLEPYHHCRSKRELETANTLRDGRSGLTTRS